MKYINFTLYYYIIYYFIIILLLLYYLEIILKSISVFIRFIKIL